MTHTIKIEYTTDLLLPLGLRVEKPFSDRSENHIWLQAESVGTANAKALEVTKQIIYAGEARGENIAVTSTIYELKPVLTIKG